MEVRLQLNLESLKIQRSLKWQYRKYYCLKQYFAVNKFAIFLCSGNLPENALSNPGRNNGRNFSGIRALTAVKISHRSRY